MSEGGRAGFITVVLVVVMVSMFVFMLLLMAGIVIVIFFKQTFKSKAGKYYSYSSLVKFTLIGMLYIRSNGTTSKKQTL